MIINTKYLGKIQINPEKILSFPQGIPAFENQKEFVLIHLPDNPIFQCLQSTQDPEVAFLIISPWDFFPDYDIHIPQEELEGLDIQVPKQIGLYNIVTIPQDPNQMTANLMGPIVINLDTLKAKQVILHQENYHTKHLLFTKKEKV